MCLIEILKKRLFTYTNNKSPRLQYAPIALAVVANPYEYTIDSSICMNFASRSSKSKCTSKNEIYPKDIDI